MMMNYQCRRSEINFELKSNVLIFKKNTYLLYSNTLFINTFFIVITKFDVTQYRH